MQDNNPNTLPPTNPPPTSPSVPSDSSNSDSNQNTQESQPPIQSGGMQNYLTSTESQPNVNRSVSGKIIATILSVLVMVGGVIAGVFLVRQQQELRKSANEQECLQSDNCVIIQDPEASGSYQINGIIYDVYLTDENANIFGAGVTEDGCYQTMIEGDMLTWERIGTEAECNNLVNIQVWLIELPQGTTDPVVSQCRDIRIYDTEWNLLDTESLSQLKAEDKIIISVGSSTTAGSIDQARFTINQQLQEPTSLRNPDTDDLYMEYQIPEGVESLEIEVELNHNTFGWF